MCFSLSRYTRMNAVHLTLVCFKCVVGCQDRFLTLTFFLAQLSMEMENFVAVRRQSRQTMDKKMCLRAGLLILITKKLGGTLSFGKCFSSLQVYCGKRITEANRQSQNTCWVVMEESRLFTLSEVRSYCRHRIFHDRVIFLFFFGGGGGGFRLKPHIEVRFKWMWRDGGCLSKRKERQNGVWVSLPACANIMVTRARSGCGANKKMAHDFDLRRAEDPQPEARVDDFAQRKGQVFFLWFSVDGKEAWSVRSMDFEEAPGRCDVRTNTVVPVLCLRLGRPRRCCTSRILSCNGVHALFLQSLVPPLSPSLSRLSYQQRRLRVATGGETLFETVCLSPSLSISFSFTVEFYGKKSIRSDRRLWFWSTVFFIFYFFFNFVKQWSWWWWDRSP